MSSAERDAVAALLLHRLVRGVDARAAADEQIAEGRDPALVAAAGALAQRVVAIADAPGQEAAVRALPAAEQASARWLLAVAASCREGLAFSSTASAPGRLEIEPGRFLRLFLPHFAPLLALIAPLPFAALVLAWWFPVAGLVAAAILVAIPAWYIGRALLRLWRYTAGKFRHGCLNPAVVVALAPCRIAVFTDLDRTSRRPWPVLKVLPVLVGERIRPGLAVGDRLVAVSYYQGGGDGQEEHWADFRPDVVDCFVSDRAAIERARHSLAPKDWRDLARALDQLPDRTAIGLHRVRLDGSDAPPADQGVAAPA